VPEDQINNDSLTHLPLFASDCEVARTDAPAASLQAQDNDQEVAPPVQERRATDSDPPTKCDTQADVVYPNDDVITSEVKNVDPLQCKTFLGAPRAGTQYNDARDGKLAASIRDNGVLEPIVVWHDGEHFRVISGNRRWAMVRHLRELGEQVLLPARRFNGDAVAALAFAHACNEGREQPTAMEQAKAVAWAVGHLGQPQMEIARALNFSEAKVSRLLILATLPEFVLDVATDANSLSEKFAADLQSALGDAEMLALMQSRAGDLQRRNITMAGPKLALFLLTGTDRSAVQEIADGQGKVIARLSSDRHGAIQLKLTPAYLPADADWEGMHLEVGRAVARRMGEERRKLR